ncbi:ion transporter [Streptomyces sp. NPDC012888]|uniref:ion transporter n=1 Tax=Streptomyces sp. NPDC012888 TaxID=3364855 RepID=UPI00368DB283
MTPEARPARRRRVRIATRCRTIVQDPAFGLAVFLLILANAAVLGVETYRGVALAYRQELLVVEQLFLALFTLELLLRAGACADRPKEFLRDPWHLFDLAVLVSAFVPLVWDDSTVLRLLRLARVLRTARFLPQLQVMLVAMGRSLPGTLSFAFIGGLVLYVYAMVGWICFSEADPEKYGSLGRAGLTLLLLTTLDGLSDAVREGLAFSRFTLLYYASYALIASFLLVNMLIGVVIGSFEEAREIEREERRKAKQSGPPPGFPQGPVPAGPPGAADASADETRERIARARRALDELEAVLDGDRLVPAGRGAER